MHFAIDDTYGPETPSKSEYVTGDRRTYVAVGFADHEVLEVRTQLQGCLEEISQHLPEPLSEFHFADIYNRRGLWKKADENLNLAVFRAFAEIYTHYKWRVFIQTVDHRTFEDHGVEMAGRFLGLDMAKFDDRAFIFLLVKIRLAYKNQREPITLFIDEGRRPPGSEFGAEIFHGWDAPVIGRYESSESEPLLQIADFIAFCINRLTYLGGKANHTEFDRDFIQLVSGMEINCPDIKVARIPVNYTVKDFDALHRQDRIEKGLEKDE